MTTVMHYSPFYGTLRRQIDRVFDELLSEGSDENRQAAVWMPRTDVSETDEQYVIRMDTPGLQREDIQLELHEGTLRVGGERRSDYEEKKETYHRVERSYGHFFRSFTLPQAGNGEKVSASLKDGVLTIEVPKKEESKPRRIQIS